MLALKPTLDKNYAVIDGLTLPYTLEEIDAICDAAALEIDNGDYSIGNDAFYERLIARVFASLEAEKNVIPLTLR